jgi:hypothetical protein
MSSTWACLKTRLEKSGAKGANACTILGGRVCTRHLFLADCGDEHTLPPSLSNSFHEKVSLVKLNVMTKAPTIQDETPLPRFHSHSL